MTRFEINRVDFVILREKDAVLPLGVTVLIDHPLQQVLEPVIHIFLFLLNPPILDDLFAVEIKIQRASLIVFDGPCQFGSSLLIRVFHFVYAYHDVEIVVDLEVEFENFGIVDPTLLFELDFLFGIRVLDALL